MGDCEKSVKRELSVVADATDSVSKPLLPPPSPLPPRPRLMPKRPLMGVKCAAPGTPPERAAVVFGALF